jgi:hypothetical protein
VLAGLPRILLLGNWVNKGWSGRCVAQPKLQPYLLAALFPTFPLSRRLGVVCC